MNPLALSILLLAPGWAGSVPACGDGVEALVRLTEPGFVTALRGAGVSASLSKDDGGKVDGVEVLFRQGDESPVKMARGAHFTRADWSGFASLRLDMENTSSTDMRLGVAVLSRADSWEDGQRASFSAVVGPGRVTWHIPLAQARYTNAWAWPEQPGLSRLGGWGRVDTSGVAGVEFSARGLSRDSAIIFRKIALEGRIPARAWVDRFGQNSCGSWPGKVESDIDITSADLREGMDLASATPFAERDEYGAWTSGKARKASGFFRVEKYGGRWWFVAPNGRPWFAVGMDCVIPGIDARMDPVVREAYSWLPPEQGEFAKAWGWNERDGSRQAWPSFYRVNLVRKWGPGSYLAKWRDRALNRTRAWGFTCLGNWSDESLFTGGIPYFSTGPDIWSLKVPFITSDIVDAFHPDFAAEAIKAASPLYRFRGDPWLVGHFVGNEMKWSEFPQKLMECPGDQPAKSVFLQKLRRKYRKIEALNSAWGTSATSFESLSWPGRRKATELAKRDMGDFLMVFADRFFRGWAGAVREADPDHLVLGTRLHQGNRPEEVVRACAKYMDVVSFNHYAFSIDRDEFDRLQAIARKPFMIGEYGFNSMDNGLLTTAVPVRDRGERGVGYRYYTEQLASVPYFVGCHYFQYLDEPITGRFDRETSYNGFVSVADIPYAGLVGAARETNYRIYEVHAGALAPFATPPEP